MAKSSQPILSVMRQALLATTCLFLCTSGQAGEVSFRSDDNSVVLVGEIVRVEEASFILRTDEGDLRIKNGVLNCHGVDCTKVEASTATQDLHGENKHDTLVSLEALNFDVNVIAPVGIGDILLPVFAQGLAEELGATAIAADVFGDPLPDDIGRPEFGTHSHFDEKAELGDLHEVGDIVDIRISDVGGDVIKHIGVVIEKGASIARLSAQRADLIFLDHPATADEIRAVKLSGGGDISAEGQGRVLAVEGLVLAVSPHNPIASIPMEKVAALFAGEIANWSELGGPYAKIPVHSFSKENAGFHYLEDSVLRPAGKDLMPDAMISEKMTELTARIAADPYGIGLVPFANLRGTRGVPLETNCGILSTPSNFNIKTEEYVLQRRYSAYNRATVSDETQRVIDLLDSPAADDLVRKAGFVDLSVSEHPQLVSAEHIQNMVFSTEDPFELSLLREMMQGMRGTNRLSTNFRFSLGSDRLDVRAQSDIQRVVDHIVENRPSSVTFVGFTDSTGSFEANLELANDRAQTVLSVIQSTLPRAIAQITELRTMGFGELSPVACNEEPNGRRINRRVEIWTQ